MIKSRQILNVYSEPIAALGTLYILSSSAFALTFIVHNIELRHRKVKQLLQGHTGSFLPENNMHLNPYSHLLGFKDLFLVTHMCVYLCVGPCTLV